MTVIEISAMTEGNKKILYALFDLDGTLLDTKEGIVSAVTQTIKEYRYDVPDLSILEGMIGPPIQISFQKLFDLSIEDAMKMANSFRNIYTKDEYLLKATPYDGILNLFQDLSDAGIGIGIATYKREDYAMRLLREKGFTKYTHFIFGSDFEGRLKKEDIIKKCLDTMKCYDYMTACYIGDGDSDGIGANSIGLKFIGVTYGFGFKSYKDAAKYNPIGIAEKCEEIGALIFNGGIHDEVTY